MSTSEDLKQPAVPVVLLHDAAIDEFISTMLLEAMPGVDLRGIILINADCLAASALDAASKLQQFLGRPDVPVALSRARGWNAFPWEYRSDCIAFGNIPSLQPFQPQVSATPPDGEELLAKLLQRAIDERSPLTLLMTGPLTPLADVLSRDRNLAKGVGRIVWMGGAIDVPGNLDPKTLPPVIANPHAEWNAFWDPFGVDEVFRQFAGIHIFPLDISNSVPVDPAFLTALQQQGQKFKYSQLAFEAYSLVTNEPFYRLWDVTTTCWLARPDLYAPSSPIPLKIDLWGTNQGWIQRVATPVTTEKVQNVYLSFANKSGFLAYVLQLLSTSGT